MAGDSLGSLVVKISGDMAELKTAMDKSTYLVEQSYSQMIKAGDRLMGSFKAIAVTAGLGFTVAGLKGAADQAIETAAAVGRLTEKVGGSASAWSGIIGAAKSTNTSFETIEQGAVRLTRAMAGSEVETKGSSKAFEFLGVSVRDASGNMRPAEKVMVDVAKALDRYQDGAGKAAIAQDIFGKGGAALLPALKELAAQGERNGKITDGMAIAAIQYEKDLKRLTATKSELTRTITFQLLPAATAIVETMTEMATRADSVNGAVKSLTEQNVLEEWAWNGAKAAAILIDTIKTIPMVIKGLAVAGDELVEGLPLGAQMKWFLEKFTDYRQKLQQAKDDYKAYVDGVQKSALDLVRAQEQAAKALAGRTGPQFYDKNDNWAHPPKLDAGRYTSGDGKDPKEAVDKLAHAKKLLAEIEGELNQVSKEETDGLVLLNQLYLAGVVSVDRLAAAATHLAEKHNPLLKLIREQTEQNLKLAATQRELNGAFADKFREELDGMKATSQALEFQNSLYGKSADEQLRLIKQFEAEKTLRADLARIYAQFGDAEDDAGKRAAASAAAWSKYATALGQIPTLFQSYANSQDAVVRQMEYENTLIGLTNVERETAIRLRALDASGIDRQSEAYANLADRIRAAVATNELRTTLVGLRDSLTDTLISAFDEGGVKGAAKAFIDWLKKQFEALVLKPLLQPVVGDVAGMVLGFFGMGASGGAGALGTAGGSAGSFGSLLSGASSLYDGASKGLGWLTGAAPTIGGQAGATGAGAGAWGGAAAADGAGFWSAGSFGAVGTAGGLLGTAALGALGGSVISSSISKDEDASRNGAIAGAAGSVIGAYVAAGTAVGGPWGAVIGAVIGGLIAAFSDADGPAMRAATVVAGRSLDQYTYSLESKLGTLGIAKGSDKWFSDSDMGATLTDWFKTIKNIDDAIADRLSEAQLAAAKIAVGGSSMTLGFGIEHQDVDPAAFGRIVIDRYGKLFGAIDESMGKLVSGFEGTTGDLLKLVDDLASVNQQLTANGDALAKVFGQSIKFGDIAAFKTEGESYSQTLTRIGQVYYATNAIAVMFGRSQEDVWHAVGLASEAARQKLIEAAGGLDVFTARLSSYYNHYFTAEERLQQTHQALAAVFANVGQEMPTTLLGFRKLIESFGQVNGISAETFTALMAIEGQFYDFVTATQKANDAIKTLAATLQEIGSAPNGTGVGLTGIGVRLGGVGTFNPAPFTPGGITNERGPVPIFTQPALSREDMDQLAKASRDAHDRIVALSEQLDKSFSNAYRSIEIAGLSNQDQYRYLQAEASRTTANLSTATSAEQVQNWSQLIIGDMQQAFSLLSPEEQSARRQEFLDNLLKVQEMVHSQLDRLDPLADGKVTPAQAAAEQQSQASNVAKQAAELLKNAAGDFQDAVAAFALAQTIPRRIALDTPSGTIEAGA